MFILFTSDARKRSDWEVGILVICFGACGVLRCRSIFSAATVNHTTGHSGPGLFRLLILWAWWGSTDIGPLIDTSFTGKQRGSNWGRIWTKFGGYYLSGFETGLKGPTFCFLNYGFQD